MDRFSVRMSGNASVFLKSISLVAELEKLKSNTSMNIATYTPADRNDLLRLLLELQSGYYRSIAPMELQEIDEEVDIRKSYSDYIDEIEADSTGSWKVLMAKTAEGLAAGFIIGQVEMDDHLVNSLIGKLEDWFVVQDFRGMGVGNLLYKEMENLFREMGCGQIQSETWAANVLSQEAHHKLGFFVSEVKMRKKL